MASNQDVGLYPKNRVVGIIQNADDLQAAVNDFQQKGFHDDEVAILCGEQGVKILDRTGKHHGLLGRVRRFYQILGDTQRDLEQYEKALQAGHFALAVPLKDGLTKQEIAGVLKAHSGYGLHYFGEWTIEDL